MTTPGPAMRRPRRFHSRPGRRLRDNYGTHELANRYQDGGLARNVILSKAKDLLLVQRTNSRSFVASAPQDDGSGALSGGRVLLELRLDHGLRHRADDLIDDLAVLEEQQHRNRADIETRSRLDVRVHIHLRDLDPSLVLYREL